MPRAWILLRFNDYLNTGDMYIIEFKDSFNTSLVKYSLDSSFSDSELFKSLYNSLHCIHRIISLYIAPDQFKSTELKLISKTISLAIQ